MKNKILVLFILICKFAFAQFDPQVGFGSKFAISKDSSIIKGWATSCKVTRGWQNYLDTTLGKATVGSEFYGTLAADGQVISLGDSGIAILQFDNPISDKPGPDFCVFENGFVVNNTKGESHTEMAFVEVSSDGINYVRFPSQCLLDSTIQKGNFEGSDVSLIDGLAGKYIANYGTPFDLNIFAPLSSINIGKITHVRLIDVVGNKDAAYPARDKNGRKIIDPWPTPFAASGFDLDAVGVINQLYNTNIFQAKDFPFTCYPNPANIGENIVIENLNNALVSVTNLQGETLFTSLANTKIEIETNKLLAGIYILSIAQQNKVYHQKISIN
ncbi:MAG: T9SS type A sorting domain-containing protein [Candidatus Methylacidiphilales bacterium]